MLQRSPSRLESTLGRRKETMRKSGTRETPSIQSLGRGLSILEACALVSARGFAVDDGEDVEELRCVAAPIRDEEGAIVASIGISAPVTRFPTSRYTATARHVSDAARKIGASLRV
jgi:DNA-binding IclR family transcriptional regulator